MKALILNGYNKEDSEIDAFFNSIMKELENKDWEIESIILRDVNVAPCQGCFDCWVKTPGECKIDDYGRDLAKKMVQSDLIIHFTPITFGGYSSELKKAVDRFIPTLLPFFAKIESEIHQLKGVGGSMDYPEITRISRDVEICLKASNLDAAVGELQELFTYCDDLVKAVMPSSKAS